MPDVAEVGTAVIGAEEECLQVIWRVTDLETQVEALVLPRRQKDMEFIAVAVRCTQSCRNRMHDGAHVGISERRCVRLVVDHHVGPRHRVTVVNGATGVLVNHVDKAALAKVAQEAFAVIREAKRYKADLPVIIITGFSTESSAIEAVNIGVAGYLTKPFRVPQVLAAAAKALGE